MKILLLKVADLSLGGVGGGGDESVVFYSIALNFCFLIIF